MKAVEFPTFRSDVIASMRRLADRIESGDYGEVRFVVAAICGPGDKLGAFAWGLVSDLEVAGAFARAAHSAVQCLGELEETSSEDGAA